MEIWWSGTHRVEVYLPDDYAHEMCGVCGDFNSDPSNDLILGPKCVGDGEPGSLVKFFLKFLLDTSPFVGPLIPCFGLLLTSPLGFKARVGSALFTLSQGM